MNILTDWYPADTKPVRPGVYILEVYGDSHIGTLMQWDGEIWRWSNHLEYHRDDRRWRGLAFDPTEPMEMVIDVEIVFTTSNGITHRETLHNVSVSNGGTLVLHGSAR